MKALVTGGAGFVGSHCVDALVEKGFNITILDDFSTGDMGNLAAAQKAAAAKKLSFDILKGSVADAALLANLPRHDLVLHLAAQDSFDASLRDPAFDFEVNAMPAKTLLSWVRRVKPRKFIYFHTANAIYGDPLSFPTDERDFVSPVSPYGATKAFFEVYLAGLSKALKASGEWSAVAADPRYFSWVSFRLSSVYGPRQKFDGGVVPAFFESIRKGQRPTIFGDGTKGRDYVHVADVVRALTSAIDRMELTAFDEAFNIGTGIETKDIEIFDMILGALQEFAREPAYSDKLQGSFKIGDPQFAPGRPGEVQRCVLNINKVDAFLAWLPQVDLKAGLRETMRAYVDASPGK